MNIGRPLRIKGRVRFAENAFGKDWHRSFSSSDLPSLEGLCEETRALLGTEWLKDAQSEHSSIAAFSLVSLELLRRGAPPELIQGSQQASLDEIEHARVAYTLASHYSGQNHGPGDLPLHGALDRDSNAFWKETVVDGCFGEEFGARAARLSAERASDPQLKAIYSRIAEDEKRHAELAWQILEWALRHEISNAHHFLGTSERLLGTLSPETLPEARRLTAVTDSLEEQGRLGQDKLHSLFSKTLHETLIRLERVCTEAAASRPVLTEPESVPSLLDRGNDPL